MGKLQVIARVLQNDNEESVQPNSVPVRTDNNRRRQGSRRVSAGNSKRQAAFKQGRKVTKTYKKQYQYLIRNNGTSTTTQIINPQEIRTTHEVHE